jgi:sortase (surface protein transpeptidase)
MPPPVRVTIPAIRVEATVVPVGLVAGTDQVAVPAWTEAGWYQLGPSPGDPGSAVIVAHVDYGHHQGVFWLLQDLTPGDLITIGYANHTNRTWQVIGRQQIAKTALPAELFSRQGEPSLALITCGGPFDPATGHYDDNLIVAAVPAR